MLAAELVACCVEEVEQTTKVYRRSLDSIGMNAIQLFFAVVVLIAILSITLLIYYSKYSNAQTQINIMELDTLDRMRYTAIQMTVLDLEGQQPTNLSNDEIVNEIVDDGQSYLY